MAEPATSEAAEQLGDAPTSNSPEPARIAVNAEADAAVTRALQALQLAQLKVQHISSQPNHRQLPPRAVQPVPSPVPDIPRPRPKRLKTAAEPLGAARSVGKGLRHFSEQVCRKVESKGRTTYSEVADELVAELSKGNDANGDDETQYDEKNIRRRVYDAINVLMAMNIIQKEKKNIIWRGLPSSRSSTEVEQLRQERQQRLQDVQQKQAYLKELVEQQRALKALLERNPDIGTVPGTTLQLPFILIQASSEATIEVHISDDMQDVQFDFYNAPFQIHDDSFVLRHMAMQHAEDEAAAKATGGPPGIAAAPSTSDPPKQPPPGPSSSSPDASPPLASTSFSARPPAEHGSRKPPLQPRRDATTLPPTSDPPVRNPDPAGIFPTFAPEAGTHQKLRSLTERSRGSAGPPPTSAEAASQLPLPGRSRGGNAGGPSASPAEAAPQLRHTNHPRAREGGRPAAQGTASSQGSAGVQGGMVLRHESSGGLPLRRSHISHQ